MADDSSGIRIPHKLLAAQRDTLDSRGRNAAVTAYHKNCGLASPLREGEL